MKNWTKKWTFPLRISLVNVTKSAVVRFTEEIFNGKIFSAAKDRLWNLYFAGVGVL